MRCSVCMCYRYYGTYWYLKVWIYFCTFAGNFCHYQTCNWKSMIRLFATLSVSSIAAMGSVTFALSNALFPINSPHARLLWSAQEGCWVGNPCQSAARLKYQSCYLWSWPSSAVETPWCQKHAGHSLASQIGLDTLRKCMGAQPNKRGCPHATTNSPTAPAGSGLTQIKAMPWRVF